MHSIDEQKNNCKKWLKDVGHLKKEIIKIEFSFFETVKDKIAFYDRDKFYNKIGNTINIRRRGLKKGKIIITINWTLSYCLQKKTCGDLAYKIVTKGGDLLSPTL